MREELRSHPAYGQLCQHIAELSMISHAPIVGYDRVSRATDDEPGGRRPPGSDRERRPRAPKGPRVEGDARSEKAWDEFDDELEAWRVCYQRRTPAYFRRELERCRSAWRLECLRDEAREALVAWRRTPLVAGVRPAMSDPRWKFWVGNCGESVKDIVRWYGVSHQYVHRIRKEYEIEEAA